MRTGKMAPVAAGTLILVCGLPGAGKTTLARRLEAERGAIRLSPDEWIEQIIADPHDTVERDRLRDPVEDLQYELALTWLAKGFTVILGYGFWSEEERSLYAMGALALGAGIELHSCEAPLEELWRRISRRNEELTNKTFVMTRQELDDAWPRYEPPQQEELQFYDDWSVVQV